MPAKNIVFCADGTWNGPGALDGSDGVATTNVFRTYANLDGVAAAGTDPKAPEQEKTLTSPAGATLQIAKYLHGVGDSSNFLVKLLGGGLGEGLIARIVRGYTFVSRNYQPGDRIFLLGFSRGAYTARALAGLIAAKGLLDANKLNLENREHAYRLGAAVWYDYRRTAIAANNLDWLGHLEAFVVDLPGFLLRSPATGLLAGVTMAAVAVWDTVGALGIPQYNLKLQHLDSFQFCDLQLSAKVARGIHAVALDEQRSDFTPTLWGEDPRVTQMLFPGAHSDVGGGYRRQNNESGLSDGALQWMTEKLSQLGVSYAANPPAPSAPDDHGVAHKPWRHPPFDVLVHEPRSFPRHVGVHPSVVARGKGKPVVAEPGEQPGPYDPRNLPPA